MSSYGADPNTLAAEHYNLGHSNGLRLGIGLGLIACIFVGAYCYEQFAFPAQVPNLSLLIGDIRSIKDHSEGMIYSITSREYAGIVSHGQSREGAGRYHALASQFNGICASLEAMLSSGHDETSIAVIRQKLADAQRQYEDFRGWFNSLPRELPTKQRSMPEPQPGGVYGALPDGVISEIAGPVVDLVKHFFDSMKELDKLKRDHLINMLRNLHFRPWHEIANSVPSSSPF